MYSSTMSNAKNFDIPVTSLNVLHNYFDRSIKLFSGLYLAKFLNTQQNRSFRIQIDKLFVIYLQGWKKIMI